MTYGASGYTTSQATAHDIVPALLVDRGFCLWWYRGCHAARVCRVIRGMGAGNGEARRHEFKSLGLCRVGCRQSFGRVRFYLRQ
jgi:hypothetical protein